MLTGLLGSVRCEVSVTRLVTAVDERRLFYIAKTSRISPLRTVLNQVHEGFSTADLPFDVPSVGLDVHLSFIPSLYLIGFVFPSILTEHVPSYDPGVSTIVPSCSVGRLLHPSSCDGLRRRDNARFGETVLHVPTGPCDTFHSTDMLLASMLTDVYLIRILRTFWTMNPCECRSEDGQLVGNLQSY